MTENRAIRLKALKDAAKDVCDHCANPHPSEGLQQFDGEWWHTILCGTEMVRGSGCNASAIWSRILFEYNEAALQDDSGEQA